MFHETKFVEFEETKQGMKQKVIVNVNTITCVVPSVNTETEEEATQINLINSRPLNVNLPLKKVEEMLFSI